ncbi:hypothetical protein [Chromobacterium phragmitis]|uniref:hypothetical protein n=1 Tax=Chromobacterium phragmitis TaxID=2202141 RepID=UPI003D36A7BD
MSNQISEPGFAIASTLSSTRPPSTPLNASLYSLASAASTTVLPSASRRALNDTNCGARY